MPLHLGSGRMDDAVLRNPTLNAMFPKDNIRRAAPDASSNASNPCSRKLSK